MKHIQKVTVSKASVDIIDEIIAFFEELVAEILAFFGVDKSES